ncbi:hypothetical protein A5724_32475 [Mycobacterium sp. ACS1612]|uniref:hypothetical protein n=1 Tax=Mycobacterium sp. ACS1612 TaxID=1834117 RepID=UPI0007FCEED1|nr:hypothetical protein [Mycobacterium sp. ACS1612]OBF26021.1 hypothetical protein A5724_32475 [Mycobacterium sp. ACS1612]
MAVTLYTQEIVGYSATAAGLTTAPIPVLSFLFARPVGSAAARIGPRIFLIAGPMIAGVGLLMSRPTARDFHVMSQMLPGMTLLATGLVLTVMPLDCGGVYGAGRRSTLNDASFLRLVQVSAVLFFLGAAVCAVTITNPAGPAEPVPCDVAALCRDRAGAQPDLSSHPGEQRCG